MIINHSYEPNIVVGADVVVVVVVVLVVVVSTFMVVRGSGSAVTNVSEVVLGNGVGKNGLFCCCSLRWLMIGRTLGIPPS